MIDDPPSRDGSFHGENGRIVANGRKAGRVFGNVGVELCIGRRANLTRARHNQVEHTSRRLWSLDEDPRSIVDSNVKKGLFEDHVTPEVHQAAHDQFQQTQQIIESWHWQKLAVRMRVSPQLVGPPLGCLRRGKSTLGGTSPVLERSIPRAMETGICRGTCRIQSPIAPWLCLHCRSMRLGRGGGCAHGCDHGLWQYV
jgi:hypothetical protein